MSDGALLSYASHLTWGWQKFLLKMNLLIFTSIVTLNGLEKDMIYNNYLLKKLFAQK